MKERKEMIENLWETDLVKFLWTFFNLDEAINTVWGYFLNYRGSLTIVKKPKSKQSYLTNHNKRKQHIEPIRNRFENVEPVPSAGKHLRPVSSAGKLATGASRWEAYNRDLVRENMQLVPRAKKGNKAKSSLGFTISLIG